MKMDDMEISEVSYVGRPRSHTVMFITKKVSNLLQNLEKAEGCLVFVEEGVEASESLRLKHRFVFSDSPQKDYAEYVNRIDEKRRERDQKRRYILTEGGYYLGENVKIGEDTVIEPGCFIGHDVKIGSNSRILYGAVIRNTMAGDHILVNEYATVGTYGFTMAEDESGNKFRIPSLGRVILGDHVEIGAHDNVSCGSAGDTVIGAYAKIDALVHIGHDVQIDPNAEVIAGAVIGGYAELGEGAFIGINGSVRNRRSIGEHTIVGMGAVVTKNISSNKIVTGNPAREH